MIKLKPTHRRFAASLLLLAIITCAALVSIHAQQPTTPSGSDQSLLKGLEWRGIGPYRGGRVTAVAGVTSQPFVYHFGATGGGVWKTTDAGMNWEPIGDANFKIGSVGAIGVAESDPNVVYVGMGESPIRGN